MNNLTKDFIAIDTNIFEHVLNPKENTNEHIDQLLKQLLVDEIKLLVDDEKRITNEYDERVTTRIKNKQTNYNFDKKILLYHWLKPENYQCITVCLNDELMIGIKNILPKPSKKKRERKTDKFFVYVALKQDRILVTNDEKDMIDEGTKQGKRCKKLLKICKKIEGNKNADILTSQIAYDRL